MGVLILEDPTGPIEDVREADGRLVVRGTGGFGINSSGVGFFDPKDEAGSEAADFSLQRGSNMPQLVRRS